MFFWKLQAHLFTIFVLFRHPSIIIQTTLLSLYWLVICLEMHIVKMKYRSRFVVFLPLQYCSPHDIELIVFATIQTVPFVTDVYLDVTATSISQVLLQSLSPLFLSLYLGEYHSSVSTLNISCFGSAVSLQDWDSSCTYLDEWIINTLLNFLELLLSC